MDSVLRRVDCPLCGERARTARGPHDIVVGKRKVTVHDEYLRCDACDEGFYRPGQFDQLQRRVAAQIRIDERLLAPAAIKAIRLRLGLSQREFERLLGVGEKTVIRWEKGTVFQSATADALMRLLETVPGAADALAMRRGVALSGGRRLRRQAR